mgnify:CR=1 FL=1
MEYSIFERLLHEKGATVYQVSKATRIAASTFTDWKNGRSVPKLDKIKLIANYFDVPLEYMLTGTGEALFIEEPIGERSPLERGKRVAIIGEIRAGSPIITNESVLGYEYADVEDKDEYFYLRVQGDSMKNIGMIHGSLVLFHKQQYAENGDIVACLVDGDSATVKRFHREGRRILLMPENDEYEPIELTPEDFEAGSARILGVAKELKIRF